MLLCPCHIKGTWSALDVPLTFMRGFVELFNCRTVIAADNDAVCGNFRGAIGRDVKTILRQTGFFTVLVDEQLGTLEKLAVGGHSCSISYARNFGCNFFAELCNFFSTHFIARI